MFKSTLRAAALAAVSPVALLVSTQAAVAQVPVGAGGQLQQIPPTPLIDKASPDLGFERKTPVAVPESGGPKTLVRSLRVTGATLFPEADLVAASGFTPNSELDMSGLKTLAARITDYYTSRGYFVANAYLPEQDVQSGAVTIAVIEGRFGAIGLKNTSRLSDRVANGMMSGLDVGDPVAVAPLERRLLMLSDLPGVRVSSTLSPGTAVGTSDLLVDITPGQTITGSVEADNAGNRYTGAYRVGGVVNWNNPTGSGDVLSLRALTSFSGLAYGRASYQAPIGPVTLGVAFAHLEYSLGKEFDSLDGSGNADVASVYASYPLIRSRDNNLYLTVGGDLKWFEDKIGVVDTVNYRRAQVVNIGLSGDQHDTLFGGGWTAFSLSYSIGNLDIRGAYERSVDALTARTDGGYGKVQFSVARLQSIAGPLSLFASVRGQIAFDNLDISEKMELGGAYAVRAYPEGEAYGDQGYVATAEARLALPQIVPGALQLFGFVDVGEVDYVKHPYFDGSNHANRSAYGAGLSWAGPYGIAARATYARKLGDEDATSAPDKSGRAWFQLSKTF
ncbi:ShlB/FhaC/HecB family hemolysin secretion/activation protein [Sphingomonas sp. PB2P12]|uniref:ShlB/FhaC/HecB family hemolysin secretion/activation protein n=1 Tax=Sphingomonas sandaracina TaxID=3096157 RepID=UPI002FCC4FA1